MLSTCQAQRLRLAVLARRQEDDEVEASLIYLRDLTSRKSPSNSSLQGSEIPVEKEAERV